MSRILTISIALVLFISCRSDEQKQRDDKDDLNKKFGEIQRLSESVSCDDENNWTYAPYGNKACGGPQGYIAYSRNMDTVQFFQLLESYRQQERAYNSEWGIISTCSIPIPPDSVVCEDGVAVLIY